MEGEGRQVTGPKHERGDDIRGGSTVLTKQERRAERIVRAMAFTRQAYKDKMLGHLIGAVGHFFMVKLAERNGQTKWVQHWNSEVDRLVNMEFVVAVLAPIKGHWDRRKAIQETVEDIRAAELRFCRAAGNYLARVYKLKKIKKDLPAGVEAEFYAMVQEAAERALSPEDGGED